MVATFFLTRAFAISALLVGALPLVYAAPVASPDLEERNCRMLGCLFAEPSSDNSPSTAVATAASVVSTSPSVIPPADSESSTESSVASVIAEVLDLISELTSASSDDASTDSAAEVPEDIVAIEVRDLVTQERNLPRVRPRSPSAYRVFHLDEAVDVANK